MRWFLTAKLRVACGCALVLALTADAASGAERAPTGRAQQLQAAARYAQSRDFDRAETILSALLTESPDDPVALNLLGVICIEQQKPDEARDLFRRAIASGHPIPGPHVNLGRLEAQDKPLEAIGELREALKIAPADPDALTLLRKIVEQSAARAMHANERDNALAIAMKARDAKPDDPELLYEFGMIASDAGLQKDAQRALEQALSLKPDYYEARYALSRVYLNRNLAAQAEEQMRKCIEARPRDASAHFGLGYILVAEQKLDDAKRAFEHSLELQPAQTESLFQLGEIAEEQGDALKAKGYFERVLAIDSHHAGALTGLAVLAYRTAQYKEALGGLRTAVASAPGYQKAHYYLALTLRKLGQTEEADKEFAIARSLQNEHTVEPELAVSSR